MIITKDMLVKKHAHQDLLDLFEQYYSNGFDCADSKTPLFDYENEMMELVGYTGLITHESNKLWLFKQRNYVNGLLNDLPNGNPASIILFDDGKLYSATYYSGGKKQNPSKYLPAYIEFRSDGTLFFRGFYENDLFHDPFPGVPALVFYDRKGNVVTYGNYVRGAVL